MRLATNLALVLLLFWRESPMVAPNHLHGELARKEQLLSWLQEPDATIQRYRAPDLLTDFLKTL